MMPVPAMLGASQLVHKPPEAKLLTIHSAHSQHQATPQHNYQQQSHMQQQHQQQQQQSKPGSIVIHWFNRRGCNFSEGFHFSSLRQNSTSLEIYLEDVEWKYIMWELYEKKMSGRASWKNSFNYIRSFLSLAFAPLFQARKKRKKKNQFKSSAFNAAPSF